MTFDPRARRHARWPVKRALLLVAAISGAAWWMAGNKARPPSIKDAVRAGDAVVVERLIGAGIAVDTRDPGTFTALQLAVDASDVQLVRMLLGAGADAGVTGPFGVTALHLASDPVIARALLVHGAYVDAWSPHRGTALHAAIEGRAPAVVALLLDNGANPNSSDAHGSTPLHRAAGHGDTTSALRLIDGGADPTVSNTRGFTPLHWAASNGHAAMAVLLLEHGAEPGRKAADGRTAGELAAANGQHRLAEMLSVRPPLDVDAQPRGGSTSSNAEMPPESADRTSRSAPSVARSRAMTGPEARSR